MVAQHTALSPLRHEQARWASGFWRDVQNRTAHETIPDMWDALSDPDVSPGVQNFLVATGVQKGVHEGPPFMDGDVYKWMEAALASFEYSSNPELAAAIERLAAMIADVQQPNGYLHTPAVISELNTGEATPLADRFHFETYNLGHLITMALRHHRLTGSDRLLEVAKKAAGFLSHLATDKPLELARSAICPSHYMAVVDLYEVTGDPQWLDLAKTFIEVRDDFQGGDDNQDRIPVGEQTVAAGHAVRANYLYAGIAALVGSGGDTGLLDTLERLWSDVVDTKMYLTGGCGALYDGASPDGFSEQSEITRVHQSYGRAYQLPHTTAHNESCASIGMILWSERMLALTGEAKYADVIEQIAFNTLMASVSLTGTEYTYTNPLRQVRDLPYPLRMPGDTALDPVPPPPPSDARLRQRYLSVFCCPPNIARTLAQFHERLASVGNDGLYIHQYGGGEVRASGDAGDWHVVEESDYPWDGRITFRVDQAPEGLATLHLRIPGWSGDGVTLTVNDADAQVELRRSSYAAIRREWRPGDVILLDLPMPVKVLRGHRLAEETANQVAFQRGPIVYCVESHDIQVPLEQLAWPRGGELTPTIANIGGESAIVLDGEFVIIPAAPDGLYGEVGDDPVQKTEARLVPYFAWGNRGAGEMSVWIPVVW